MKYNHVIKISDFTVVPGARNRNDGDGSAQEFFEDYLKPFIDKNKNNGKLLIDFDKTWGYASSFISELAKDLVINYGREFINSNIHFKSDDDLMLIERLKFELGRTYEK